MDDLSPALGGLPGFDADLAVKQERYPHVDPSTWEVLGLRELLGQRRHHAPILVWSFDTAPPELQALSPHGGDEDWVAFVPSGYCYDEWRGRGIPRWIEAMGACDISEHVVQVAHNEARVYIGAHA